MSDRLTEIRHRVKAAWALLCGYPVAYRFKFNADGSVEPLGQKPFHMLDCHFDGGNVRTGIAWFTDHTGLTARLNVPFDWEKHERDEASGKWDSPGWPREGQAGA